ncbi:6-bladed beta-propeller [candidate division KSB1 bacterium]
MHKLLMRSNKVPLLIFVILCLLVVIIFGDFSGEEVVADTVKYEYSGEVFVDRFSDLGNENLIYPSQVRISPFGEIVVMDMGNSCLYVFSQEGKFLRRIGDKIDDPGQLKLPRYFDINSKGYIYVYDNGKKRITIFNPNGSFSGMIPVHLPNNSRFSINYKDQLVVNIPAKGYYITVISKEGRLVRNIGKIPVYNFILPSVNSLFAEGFPFEDAEGDYFIFLKHMPMVKKYNSVGVQKEEFFLHKPHDKFIFPSDLTKDNMKLWVFLPDIVFKDSRFYVHLWKGELLVLDNRLNLLQHLFFDPNIMFEESDNYSWKNKAFAYSLEDSSVYFPTGNKREIYKFSKNRILY